MLPFRLFTVSLLFRMSSKVSDACTKAAGAVYSRALVQGAYAVLVLAGAFVGQRWGIGGVAIAVSIAMGINWLADGGAEPVGHRDSPGRASRGRRRRASLLAGAVAGARRPSRSTLRGPPTWAPCAILAAAEPVAARRSRGALKSRSELFLGPHGVWASRHAEELIRQGLSVRAGPTAGGPAPTDLAEANSK